MVIGNRLVELNLTSKRNSGWVDGFIIYTDQGVWSSCCGIHLQDLQGTPPETMHPGLSQMHTIMLKYSCPPRILEVFYRGQGAGGQWLRDLRASGSHLKSSLSITGWSMVTLKNIDSATHESWRYPTKHVFPESVFWGILHLASAKCTLLMPNAHFDGNW